MLDNGVEATSGIITSKGKNIIYDNFDITSTERELTIYIWISIDDGTDDDLSMVATSTYSGGISMSAEGR